MTQYQLVVTFNVECDWNEVLHHASDAGESILRNLKADQWMLLSIDGDLCWKEHMEYDNVKG